MGGNECVLVASDCSSSLSYLLKILFKVSELNIVAASRERDCLSMARSLHPRLMVLYFRNVNGIMTLFNGADPAWNIPIIFLTRRNEPIDFKRVNKLPILFQSYDFATKGNYLRSNVHNLLRLGQFNANDVPKKREQLASHVFDKNLARYSLEVDQKITMLAPN